MNSKNTKLSLNRLSDESKSLLLRDNEIERRIDDEKIFPSE